MSLPPTPRVPAAPATRVPVPDVTARRWLLLRRSAAPVVIALLVAVKLLTMWSAGNRAVDGYAAGSAGTVAAAAGWMEPLNVVERHKAPWARGDAAVLAGDYELARSSFDRALGLVAADSADGCRLRVNLGLALERLAGQAAAADLTSAVRDHLTRIGELVEAAPPRCADPGEATGPALAGLAQRARAGLAALDVPVVVTPGGSSIADRQKALLDRMRQSAQERARTGPGGASQAPAPGTVPGPKPW